MSSFVSDLMNEHFVSSRFIEKKERRKKRKKDQRDDGRHIVDNNVYIFMMGLIRK